MVEPVAGEATMDLSLRRDVLAENRPEREVARHERRRSRGRRPDGVAPLEHGIPCSSWIKTWSFVAKEQARCEW